MTTKKRRVDQWRSILDWTEAAVWKELQEAGIRPHPCYEYGYGRASCAFCIFGGAKEWATARQLNPHGFYRIAKLEERFGKTIHRTRSVIDQADRGEPFVKGSLKEAREALLSDTYDFDIQVSPEDWKLPSGAFRHTAGPS